MQWNRAEFPELVQLGRDRKATAFNAYFLVCTGRGEKLSDVSPDEYEETLRWLVEEEQKHAGVMMVRAKCAPHAARVAFENGSPVGGSAGCLAGKSYVRIGTRGEVTPCPYMPIEVGNVLEEDFGTLWRSAPLFEQLRNGTLEGRCGECEHQKVCGGCRARALATSGEVMGEDPWCTHQPSGVRPDDLEVGWTPEARERLARVPAFIRSRLEKGLEAHARARGMPMVTAELMAEIRKNSGVTMPTGGGHGVS
jgi:radical SAM protein with 4Fe4S-binding SPASM domain